LCGATASLRGVVMRADQQIERYYDANVAFTNCVLCNYSNIVSRELTKIVGRQRWFKHYFTYNLKIVDENGNAISGATVKVFNKNNVQEFSTTTDANGLISEQSVLQYHKQ